MDPRELFGWNRDANRSAAARARETGEDINLTAWESFMGGNADHAANINKRKKQEDLNTQGDFEEDLLREDLALMDAPELTRLVQALEANHF